ncbi:hypothetical protein quinque_013184 [Culex quinquefasciatus]
MNQLGCTAATFRRLLLLVAVVGLLVATVEAKKKPNKYGDGDFEFVDEQSGMSLSLMSERGLSEGGVGLV